MFDALIQSLPLLAHGLLTTLELVTITICMSIVFALILDWVTFSSSKTVNKIIDTITFIIRSVPEMVLLFLLYFGLLTSLKFIFGHYVNCSPFISGTVTLTIIYSSFLLPVFTGAKNSVMPAQKQAASLLGLSLWQQYILIIKPQSIKHAIPGCINLTVCLVKDTALLSLIGTTEFMETIQLNAINNHAPFLFYSIACIVYLTISLLLESIINKEYNAKGDC